LVDDFFQHPILNSPYEYPVLYWELDDQGQSTQRIIESHRKAEFTTPIPKSRKRKGLGDQRRMVFAEGTRFSTSKQGYKTTSTTINELRRHIDQWRSLKE
jgi:type III restriction enzyme